MPTTLRILIAFTILGLSLIHIYLANDAVEVYRDPDARGYRQLQRSSRGSSLTALLLPDMQVGIDEVLGAALD